MNILILTEDYPDKRRSVFPFVKQLVDTMAGQGHDVQVVVPYSITRNKHFYQFKENYQQGNGTVTVYRPMYLSLSKLKIGDINLSYLMIQNAFNRGLKRLDKKPDVIYGHFWHTAYCGYKYAVKNRLPIFVASGESQISFRPDSTAKRSFCGYVSGVICVSTKNKEESVDIGLTIENNCVVLPNAIDKMLFKPLDKRECRKQLGLPLNAFIVIFVGGFKYRKGTRRVSEAISNIDKGEKVYSIFIGEGNEAPDNDNILYKGLINHSDVPYYLNASDVFVLPTLHEGCCNAIVEAMACGLPIISSDLPFNKDICNVTNSILVNPLNINEISSAIISLRDDTKLKLSLSKGAISTSENLSIDERAMHIIEFIKEKSF